MAKTIVEVLQGVIDELAALRAEMKTRLDAIELRLPAAAPAPSPGVVTAPSIWDGLGVDNKLAPYEPSDAGWMSPQWRSVDYPGDLGMLLACWMGVEPPTGRTMHGGDTARMHAARKLALQLHDLDVAGRFDGTLAAQANVSPEAAACLLCLRLVDVEQGGLGSNASRSWGAWANMVDLQTLFLRLKDLSEGTGGPSGM